VLRSSESLNLSEEEVRLLRFMVKSKNLDVMRAKRRERGPNMSTDAFLQPFALFDDLRSGRITQISFRNESLGDFCLAGTKSGEVIGCSCPSTNVIDRLE